MIKEVTATDLLNIVDFLQDVDQASVTDLEFLVEDLELASIN